MVTEAHIAAHLSAVSRGRVNLRMLSQDALRLSPFEREQAGGRDVPPRRSQKSQGLGDRKA